MKLVSTVQLLLLPIRDSSNERLHQEPGFEYLISRRRLNSLRKLYTFYRIVRNKFPGYFYKYILLGRRAYLTRNSNNIKRTFSRSEYFANSSFPYTIKEWSMLGLEIRNSESYSIFKKSLLKFTRTIPNSVLSVANIYGIKLLTRLRVALSHLGEHKFGHNFQDTINTLCSCSLEIESRSQFFCTAKISSPQELISWINSVNLILIFLI